LVGYEVEMLKHSVLFLFEFFKLRVDRFGNHSW
jgi:hypothetical protein